MLSSLPDMSHSVGSPPPPPLPTFIVAAAVVAPPLALMPVMVVGAAIVVLVAGDTSSSALEARELSPSWELCGPGRHSTRILSMTYLRGRGDGEGT